MFLISDLLTLSHQIAQNCVKIAVLFSNISFFMPQVRLIVREERKGNYLHKEIFIRGCGTVGTEVASDTKQEVSHGQPTALTNIQKKL